MTPLLGIGRGRITVGRRLFMGVLPAVLAVALAIVLAYYGQYGHEIPPAVLALAAVLALLSLGITWRNARYLQARIARLAGALPGTRGEPDELDRIEHVVDRLGSALSMSEAERERAGAAAATRLSEQGTMLAAVTRDTIARLDEVRMPLHILLDSPFGELNENQEELLRDARAAADAMDVALRRLAQVADADRGALPVQRELVQVNDVVRGVLPLARAAAERRGARVEIALEPGLPRVLADRARLAEALTLLAEQAASETGPARTLRVGTARENGGALITLAPRPSATESGVAVADVVARRLIESQGGSIERSHHPFAPASGSESVNTLPPPGRAAYVSVPPCASASPRAIDSPSPEPPTSGGAPASR